MNQITFHRKRKRSNEITHSRHINPDILIQVDATVIAGVLILLTIGSVFPFAMNRKISSSLTPATAVAIILFPFAISIMSLLYPDFIRTPTTSDIFGLIPYAFNFAVFSAIAGFVYMLVIIMIIVRAEDINEKPKRSQSSFKIRTRNKVTKAVKITRIFSSEYRKRNKRKKQMIKKGKKIFKQP